MAHLGKLGFLVELKCAASLSLQTVRPARARTTLGGVNTVQVGARTNRTWDVSLSDASTPAEHAEIRAFVEGEHGLGPWCFVSDWASVTNVISPRGSVLEVGIPQNGSSLNGGSMVLPDGNVAGRSLLVSSPTTAVVLPRVDSANEPIPVIPGVKVTGSVWALGSSARLRLRFYDLAGNILATFSGASFTAVTPTRLILSAVPPAESAYGLLIVDGVTRVARPALSWTDSARPWSVGEGAPMAHVSEVGTNIGLATREIQYGSASYQIVEVG